jgi:hypothetical protein
MQAASKSAPAVLAILGAFRKDAAMKAALFVVAWFKTHRWAILLVAILLLLIISPFSGVYDRNDNLISPLAAIVVLAVTACTVQRFLTGLLMTGLTLLWLVISIATDGSGLLPAPPQLRRYSFLS